MSLAIINNSLLDLNYSKDLTKTSAASEYEVIYEYASATQINYIYLYRILSTLRRAAPSGSNSLEIDIISSDDESYTDGETVTFQIGESDLVGLVSKDYIRAVTFTTGYLFYKIKVKIITGSNIQFDQDTVYIGRSDTFCDYPDVPIDYEVRHPDNARLQSKIFTLNYSGIAESLRTDIHELEKYKTTVPLVLWDKTAGKDIIPNDQVLSYCRLIEVNYTPRISGYFDISFLLEEIY